MEVGPFRVRGDKLIENEGSWNEFANLLFGEFYPLKLDTDGA